MIAILDIHHLSQNEESIYNHQSDEYEKRFKAFGFEAITIDGHDLNELDTALHIAHQSTYKPVAIIVNTLIFKEIFCEEGRVGWQDKVPNANQLSQALN